MSRVEKTIEVGVPVRVAYNQWTQFESFPAFMEGVHEVRQLDDRHLHWRAKVGGKEEEWDAEIREQLPDEKIIWRATSGAENAGMVTFDDLGMNRTRVHLEMSYDPEGFVESAGDAFGFVSRRVEGDLQRFKEYIEARGLESGGWRGTIENERVSGGHTRGDSSASDSGKGPGQHANLEGSGRMAADAGAGPGYPSVPPSGERMSERYGEPAPGGSPMSDRYEGDASRDYGGDRRP